MINPQYSIAAYSDSDILKIEQSFLSSTEYLPTLAGDYNRKRDISIFKVAVSLGLRPSEALCLVWANIDWDNDIVRINPYKVAMALRHRSIRHLHRYVKLDKQTIKEEIDKYQ